jgi:DNA-binding HxlR family transcriptional regulator
MNRQNLYESDCPILNALNILGGKWRLPILWYLSNKSLRYNELKRHLPEITNIMLTRSLKDLEAHGLVSRVQYSEIPPHVEYLLAEQGKKLVPAMTCLQEWGKEQILLEQSDALYD